MSTLESLDQILLELLDAHANEILKRGLLVSHELQPDVQIEADDTVRSALQRLLRFVFATLPDRCDLYLACSRPPARMAPVGSAVLVARWQVVGGAVATLPEEVLSMHPVRGNAAEHAESAQAARLVADFVSAGWQCEIGQSQVGDELMVRAERR